MIYAIESSLWLQNGEERQVRLEAGKVVISNQTSNLGES